MTYNGMGKLDIERKAAIHCARRIYMISGGEKASVSNQERKAVIRCARRIENHIIEVILGLRLTRR